MNKRNVLTIDELTELLAEVTDSTVEEIEQAAEQLDIASPEEARWRRLDDEEVDDDDVIDMRHPESYDWMRNGKPDYTPFSEASDEELERRKQHAKELIEERENEDGSDGE